MRDEPAAAAGDEDKVVTGDVRDEDKRDGESGKSSDQEFIFIHDTGFTVKIVPPGVESFEIQVSIAPF